MRFSWLRLSLMAISAVRSAALPEECRANGVCTLGMVEGPCWYTQARVAGNLPAPMWVMFDPKSQPDLAASGCETFEKLGRSHLSSETVLGYGLYASGNVTCPDVRDFVCCESSERGKCSLSTRLGPLQI